MSTCSIDDKIEMAGIKLNKSLCLQIFFHGGDVKRAAVPRVRSPDLKEIWAIRLHPLPKTDHQHLLTSHFYLQRKVYQ